MLARISQGRITYVLLPTPLSGLEDLLEVQPYAIRDAIEGDLEWLEKLGEIEKVNFSEQANPVVPIPTGDGSVRLLRGFQSHPESCVTGRPTPHSQTRRFADSANRRGEVLKTRPLTGLPTDRFGLRRQEVYNNQHSQGVILIYEVTIWHSIGTCNLLTFNGRDTQWN